MIGKKIMSKQHKISPNTWLTVLLFGFCGQVAWVIENNYFNVFMDRTITHDPFAIAFMVAASAVVATFVTLIAGTWSDKLGNRRSLMSYGYVIWGVIIISFSFIKVEYVQDMFKCSRETAQTVCVAVVVVMDCVMTLFGSTSNDAAYNAWVTDNTTPKNRGTLEGVIAVMPLFAMAVVFGLFDEMTKNYYELGGEIVRTWSEGAVRTGYGEWTKFYCILGGFVILVGIVGIFTVKDSPNLKPNPSVRFKDMFYGAKKEVVKANKNLYLCYLTLMFVGIANNCFMSYLFIYLEKTLGYADYIIPVGIIMVTAAIGSVVFGIGIDKFSDRRKPLFFLVGAYVVGAVLMLLASPLTFKSGTPLWAVCIGGFVLMAANLCISANVTAMVRDLTPPDKAGQFQGVRMFFWVLVPMCVGPMLTAIITKVSTTSPAVDEFGEAITVYSPYMFLLSAIIALLSIVPIVFLMKAKSEEMKPFEAAENPEITDDVLSEQAV